MEPLGLGNQSSSKYSRYEVPIFSGSPDYPDVRALLECSSQILRLLRTKLLAVDAITRLLMSPNVLKKRLLLHRVLGRVY
jgi:hypothetical protein